MQRDVAADHQRGRRSEHASKIEAVLNALQVELDKIVADQPQAGKSYTVYLREFP